MKCSKNKGSSVVISAILLAGVVCMVSFFIALEVNFSNASYYHDKDSFQAQQYAMTRSEVVAGLPYLDIAPISKHQIKGTDYYEELLLEKNSGDTKKTVTVNIYKGSIVKPLATLKLVRNRKDTRLDDFSEALASSSESRYAENKTLNQKAVVDNFALINGTVKSSKSVKNVGGNNHPVFYDNDGILKSIKYVLDHSKSDSDSLVVWDGNKLDNMLKSDIPNLISDVKIAVPGYIVFSNGVVFAWGNYSYTHANINEACAVTVKKPYKFKTLICQIQDSMERNTSQPFSMYRFGWASSYTTDTTETFAATGGKNLTVFWIGKRI